MVKALTSALRSSQLLTLQSMTATDEVIQKHYYNIGIAADTEKGLLVPVVKNADRKSVFEISDRN